MASPSSSSSTASGASEDADRRRRRLLPPVGGGARREARGRRLWAARAGVERWIRVKKFLAITCRRNERKWVKFSCERGWFRRGAIWVFGDYGGGARGPFRWAVGARVTSDLLSNGDGAEGIDRGIVWRDCAERGNWFLEQFFWGKSVSLNLMSRR